jgi:hypothetical protein
MKRIILLFAVLALLAGATFAQNGAFAPYATGSVSTSSALGYKNPDFTVGAGIESSTQYLLLDIHGLFDTANLTVTDKGYTGTIQASGYYKFFGHMLAGAGANWSVNTAEATTFIQGTQVRRVIDATRQSAHPFVGGGFQFGKVRVIANYNLPGKNALTNERIVNVNTEVFATKHLRLTQDTTINSYVDGSNIRVTGTKLGAGLKLVL